MRKRSSYKPRPKGLPISFRAPQAGLQMCELQMRAALDNVLGHTASEQDIEMLASAAMYCGRMCLRLAADGMVDADAAAAVSQVVADGAYAVAEVQARYERTGKIGCTGDERTALLALLDAYTEIDRVGTRRQSRDVLQDILVTAAVAVARKEAANA